MVLLGVILLVLGLLTSLSILFWIGGILLALGLIINFVPFGGTRNRVW